MTGYRLCDFSVLSFDILIVGLNVGQEILIQINEMFCCCSDMRFRDCLLPFWSLKTIQVAKNSDPLWDRCYYFYLYQDAAAMIPMTVSPPTKVPPIAAASANIPNILFSPFFDVDQQTAAIRAAGFFESCLGLFFLLWSHYITPSIAKSLQRYMFLKKFFMRYMTIMEQFVV